MMPAYRSPLRNDRAAKVMFCPKPVVPANISATTAKIKETVIAKRKPAKMSGMALGRAIFQMKPIRLICSMRDTSTNRGSMVLKPWTVLSNTGQSDENMITAMIIRSFSPIHKMNKGMMAEAGKGLIHSRLGSK